MFLGECICFHGLVIGLLLDACDWLNKFFFFQVNYINAHATSTLAGDLAEINAIKKVFKNTSEIKINATKVNSLGLSMLWGCVFLLTCFFQLLMLF